VGISAVSPALADGGSEGCEAAVDMADSHDFEDFHKCHKEKTGINRFFKRLTKSETKVRDTQEVHRVPEQQQIRELDLESIALQRQTLLRQMAADCTQGFRIEAEQYRPNDDGVLVLSYQYQCL